MTPHVSHVEWRVSDLARSVAFLEELFGWRFERYSTHYRLYQPAQGVAVGLLETAEQQPGLSPMVHIRVDDLEATLTHARALGARVVVKRTAVPGHGWYAQFEDHDGNLIGLFEAVSCCAAVPCGRSNSRDRQGSAADRRRYPPR